MYTLVCHCAVSHMHGNVFIVEDSVDVQLVTLFDIGNESALTHLSLEPHICVSESGQHWFS